MKCINCDKEFIPQRSTAKFCSDSCRVEFNRKDSVTPNSVIDTLNVTDSVTTRWEYNGYHNKEDAIFKAIGDVLEKVPDCTLVLGSQIFTNIKESKVVISRAKYCPKHNKIQMGKQYACGCKL